MARNGSGDFSLYTPGNPTVDGQTITKDYLNNTLSDIATEVTDSLSRSNKGAMLAPLHVTDGTAAAPSVAFETEPTTGVYRVGAGVFGLSILGTAIARISDGEFWVNLIQAFATSTGLTLKGRPAANGTAVIADSTAALTDAAARIASFRNNGTDKLSIDKDGGIVGAAAGTSVTVKGTVADGATAIGVVLDNSVALANASAKIASFKNAGVEKAYINKDGNLVNSQATPAAAWAKLSLGAAGAVTVTKGFNVASATWATSTLTVTLTAALADANGAVMATPGAAMGNAAYVTGEMSAANTVLVKKWVEASGSQDFANGNVINLVVFN